MVEHGYGGGQIWRTARKLAPWRAPTPAGERSRQKARRRKSARWAAAITFWKCSTWSRCLSRESRERFGLRSNQVVVLIHSGSRGLGHQVCTDYLRDEWGHASLRHRPAGPPTGLRAGASRRKGKIILAPCAPRRILPGPIARGSRTLPARRSSGSSASRGIARHLRRVPQHRQARTPPGGRPRARSDGAPQGRHARLSRRAIADVPEVPARGPAGADSRIDGDLVLCAGGRGGRHARKAFGTTCHGAGRVMSRTGREDLNLRPPGPEPGALPGCATPRLAHSDETAPPERRKEDSTRASNWARFLPLIRRCKMRIPKRISM